MIKNLYKLLVPLFWFEIFLIIFAILWVTIIVKYLVIVCYPLYLF